MHMDTTTLRAGWLIVDGYPLFHRASTTAGPDAPAMVHVHGFGISGTYLMPTAERLTHRFNTFVPDLPGMGRSMRRERTLDIQGLAKALISYCDEVGVEKATFVGNSLGCPIIGEVATSYPERIESAVLVSPAGGPMNQPLRRAIGQMALDGPREPLGMVPIAVRDYLRFGVLQGLHLFKAMMEFPTLDRVRHFDMPTLLVAGARDPLVHTERVSLFAGLPHVSAVRVPGAHALNFSAPELIAALIEAHVDGAPLHTTDGPLSVVELFEIPA
jgi:pimeloyl-ACP methyl ester carboxylesterase